MADDPAPDAEPRSSTFDGEDFLFHLYRGSELLQDNLVEDARVELEAALSMQPRDVEGQALLGVVYFRLGNYERAIRIYEDLARLRPSELVPKVNLGLCYLKTGQYPEARRRLEEVVASRPDHARAWGYLGLVFERLGDVRKAAAAFERAGQPHMARRVERMATPQVSEESESDDSDRAAMQDAAAHAVHELDADSDAMPFALAGTELGDSAPSRSGRWRAIELGQARLPPPGRPLRATAPSERHELPPPSVFGDLAAPASVRGSVPAPAMGLLLPPSPSQLARDALLVFPDDPTVAMHADGVVLVHVKSSFAVRSDALRAMSGSTTVGSRALRRRGRGRDLDELLGGAASPIVLMEGAGHLVLGALPERRIAAIDLQGEFLYVREERLVGFEHSVSYESGRLPLGDGEFVAMTQLSGKGSVIVETRRLIEAVEIGTEHPALIRGDLVLGWTGRLIPRGLAASEAPGSARGFVTFSGVGAVFMDAG